MLCHRASTPFRVLKAHRGWIRFESPRAGYMGWHSLAAGLVSPYPPIPVGGYGSTLPKILGYAVAFFPVGGYGKMLPKFLWAAFFPCRPVQRNALGQGFPGKLPGSLASRLIRMPLFRDSATVACVSRVPLQRSVNGPASGGPCARVSAAPGSLSRAGGASHQSGRTALRLVARPPALTSRLVPGLGLGLA